MFGSLFRGAQLLAQSAVLQQHPVHLREGNSTIPSLHNVRILPNDGVALELGSASKRKRLKMRIKRLPSHMTFEQRLLTYI
jgi:hypothetical protein